MTNAPTPGDGQRATRADDDPYRYQCPFCGFADADEAIVRLHITRSDDDDHHHIHGFARSTAIDLVDDTGQYVGEVDGTTALVALADLRTIDLDLIPNELVDTPRAKAILRPVFAREVEAEPGAVTAYLADEWADIRAQARKRDYTLGPDTPGTAEVVATFERLHDYVFGPGDEPELTARERDVLQAVADGHNTHSKLGAHFDTSGWTARQRLDPLREAGLVTRAQDGSGPFTYHLTDAGEQALAGEAVPAAEPETEPAAELTASQRDLLQAVVDHHATHDDLGDHFDVTGETIRQRLALLLDRGLVTRDRPNQNTHYVYDITDAGAAALAGGTIEPEPEPAADAGAKTPRRGTPAADAVFERLAAEFDLAAETDHPHTEREVLGTLYYDHDLSQTKMGDVLGVDQPVISKWMRYHGINPGRHGANLDGEWRAMVKSQADRDPTTYTTPDAATTAPADAGAGADTDADTADEPTEPPETPTIRDDLQERLDSLERQRDSALHALDDAEDELREAKAERDALRDALHERDLTAVMLADTLDRLATEASHYRRKFSTDDRAFWHARGIERALDEIETHVGDPAEWAAPTDHRDD